MNGTIRINDAGTMKSFNREFVKDIFFGKIFLGAFWKDIEPDIAEEDKEEAKRLYDESRKEWFELTSAVGLKKLARKNKRR